MHHTLRNVFLFVYEFAGDIHVWSKPMGIKKPKFVFGQIAVCPVGVEKTAQPTVTALQIWQKFLEWQKKKVIFGIKERSYARPIQINSIGG